jgi:hypothetical protein
MPDDQFGFAVALEGDIAAVSACAPYLITKLKPGRVLLFHRDGGVWTPFAELSAPAPFAGDRFGFALAMKNGRLLVGASPPSFAMVPGAYLYRIEGLGVTLDATLEPIRGIGKWRFGQNVALSENRAAVGSAAESIPGQLSYGGVHLYQHTARGWIPHAHIDGLTSWAVPTVASVGITSDRVVVGTTPSDPGAGQLHVFGLTPRECEP